METNAYCAVCSRNSLVADDGWDQGALYCGDEECPGWLVPISPWNMYGLWEPPGEDLKPWDAPDIAPERLALWNRAVARAHAQGVKLGVSATYVPYADLAAMVAEIERARGDR